MKDEKILVIIGDERYPSFKLIRLAYRLFVIIKNKLWIDPFIKKIWGKEEKVIFFVLDSTIQRILTKKNIPFKTIDSYINYLNNQKEWLNEKIFNLATQWYKKEKDKELQRLIGVNIANILELELMSIFQKDIEKFELIRSVIEEVKPTKIFIDEYSIKKIVERLNLPLNTQVLSIIPNPILKFIFEVRLLPQHFFKINFFKINKDITKEKTSIKKDKDKVLIVTGGFTPIVTLIPVIKELKKDDKTQIVVLVVRTEKPREGEINFTKNDIPYKTLGNYMGKGIKEWINKTRKMLDILSYNKKLINALEKSLLFKAISSYGIQKRDWSIYLSKRIGEIKNYLEIIEKVIDREKPKIIVVMNDRYWSSRGIIEIGKVKNIPTVGIQDAIGADVPQSWIVSADKLAIYGNYMKEMLVKKGVLESRLVITGDPRYDYISCCQNGFKKEEVYQQLNIDIQKKIIVFASQLHGFKYEENKKLFCGLSRAMLSLPTVQLVVKLHPFDFPEIVNKITSEVDTNNIIIIKDIDLHKLLNTCEILMTVCSTVALEAMILNKPVIIVNLTNKSDLVPYVNKGAALGIYKEEDIANGIKMIMEDSNNIKSQIMLNQKKFIFDYAYKVDGKSSRRIVDLIYSMIDESL